MEEYKQKIFDGVVIKIIVEILFNALTPVLIIVIGAFNFKNSAIPTDIWILLAVCFAAIIALSVASWLAQSKYPVFKWNFTHEANLYKMTFLNRENLEYNRYLNVKLLCADISEFNEGEYIWSGSDSRAELIHVGDFSLVLCDKGDGSSVQKYTVKANNALQRNHVYAYGLKIMLEDAYHSMKCENSIFIKRPTKEIRLELNVPSTVRVKNVSQKAWSLYGDQKPFDDKKIQPMELGGVEYKNISYRYTVSHPKLFCVYAITWEWD